MSFQMIILLDYKCKRIYMDIWKICTEIKEWWIHTDRWFLSLIKSCIETQEYNKDFVGLLVKHHQLYWWQIHLFISFYKHTWKISSFTRFFSQNIKQTILSSYNWVLEVIQSKWCATSYFLEYYNIYWQYCPKHINEFLVVNDMY